MTPACAARWAGLALCLLAASGCGLRAGLDNADPGASPDPSPAVAPPTVDGSNPTDSVPAPPSASHGPTTHGEPTRRAAGGGELEVVPGSDVTDAPERDDGPRTTSQTTDRCGDLVDGVGEQPAWSDVAEVVVTHDRSTLVVEIRLCGVPEPRPDWQLNLLHVHDTDGDGTAEREVWATLTEQGWRASRYLAAHGRAFAVPSGDIPTVQDRQVVQITVPRELVDPLPRT